MTEELIRLGYENLTEFIKNNPNLTKNIILKFIEKGLPGLTYETLYYGSRKEINELITTFIEEEVE